MRQRKISVRSEKAHGRRGLSADLRLFPAVDSGHVPLLSFCFSLNRPLGGKGSVFPPVPHGTHADQDRQQVSLGGGDVKRQGQRSHVLVCDRDRIRDISVLFRNTFSHPRQEDHLESLGIVRLFHALPETRSYYGLGLFAFIQCDGRSQVSNCTTTLSGSSVVMFTAFSGSSSRLTPSSRSCPRLHGPWDTCKHPGCFYFSTKKRSEH